MGMQILFVITSHRRSGVARTLMGSVAREVASWAQVPTLVFRLPSAVTPQMQAAQYTILVLLDESLFAESALPSTIALARTLDATLVLFEVLPSPSAAVLYDRELLERAEKYLHQQCDQLTAQAISARMRISIGDPATQIVERAQEPNNGCDLIVVTIHACTGLDRLCIGGVADEVFRHTQLPLMILHPAE